MFPFPARRPPRSLVVVLCAVSALAWLALPASAGAAQSSAFVSNFNDGTISQYSIGSGESLSANGTANSGTNVEMLAVTPNGKYLYATDNGGDDVSQYSVGLDGTLTALAPATVGAGSEPVQIAVSPDGHNVYVANSAISGGTGSVSVYHVGSGGALTLTQTVTTGLVQPSGVAVSPHGGSVYVADGQTQNIVEFNRASDGSLTAKSTPTIATPDSGLMTLTISPNGQNVYVSGSYTTTIGEYTVGSGGELSLKATPTVPEGQYNVGLSVSPNGRNVYAASCGNTYAVYQYSVGTAGALAPLSPASVPTGGQCPEQQWLTAGGRSLYSPDFGNPSGPPSAGDVSQFNVSSTGALSAKTPATVPAGSGAGGVVIPPDQGPMASFSYRAGSAGKPTAFNGSGSSASGGGSIARYEWSFGDGTTLRNGGATPSHTYRKAGVYRVTLTVTDDSGCSTALVFTGQTAYCNGTSTARTTRTVKVSEAALKLAVSPSKASAGHTTCFAFTVSSGGGGASAGRRSASPDTLRRPAATAQPGCAQPCRRGSTGPRHPRPPTGLARLTFRSPPRQSTQPSPADQDGWRALSSAASGRARVTSGARLADCVDQPGTSPGPPASRAVAQGSEPAHVGAVAGRRRRRDRGLDRVRQRPGPDGESTSRCDQPGRDRRAEPGGHARRAPGSGAPSPRRPTRASRR